MSSRKTRQGIQPTSDPRSLHEDHSKEQFFFDANTTEVLASFVEGFSNPCCLCTPTVGSLVEEEGLDIATLDIDERFNHLKGFRRFDLYRPEHLGEEYDLILCDPPFFKVSLSQLFKAVRMLSRFDFEQPLMIAFLKRREPNILGTFAPFNLRPTGLSPVYRTLVKHDPKTIEFYSNLPAERLANLILSI